MELEKLKEWATPRQCEIIDAIKTHGSKAAAAKALGIRRQSLHDSIKGLQKRAARKNYAPDHGWVEPLPPGFANKRVSEMKRNADGDPMWVIYIISQLKRLVVWCLKPTIHWPHRMNGILTVGMARNDP